jgi:hypothetical protein
MLTRSLLIPALLAAGFAQAPAPAAPEAAASAAGPDAKERTRIEALMRRAVAAARKEAEAARTASGLEADDRRDAQTQLARLLRHAEGCGAAESILRERPEILGAGVLLVVSDSLRYGDRACAVALAPLILERWQDPYYTEPGRISLRFQAGAVLDSAGLAEGRRIMSDAEARLMAPAHSDTRWDARWHAIDAYEGTPALPNYLEYLAGRMVAEPRSYSDSKRNGLFTLFAHLGRCDLVERVAKPGSCDEPKRIAKQVYGDPSPAMVESVRFMASWLGVEEPTLDEQGLRKVLKDPAPWGRVSKLLVFVSYCRWVLDGRLKPGGA